MKRTLIVLMLIGLLSPMAFAGGIVTNANQSAAYIRMPAQDASISIDALYYNPAGLAFLPDGFHISLSNQYILQTRDISSTFPMARQDFEGGVVAPLFPSVYLAYKKDKVAFSFGFNPIGGGGSAMFEDGLPSFEKQIAILPPSLSASGLTTTEYSFDTEFEGKSTMYGMQLNASYAINEMISFSLGIRYIIAKNSYVGNMKNIMINPNQPAFNQGGRIYAGDMVSAPQFFTDAATTLSGWAAGATAFVTGLTPIVSGGGGAVLLANGTSVGLTATQVAQIQGLLGAAGLTPAQIGAIDIQTAQGTLNAAAPVFTAKATGMTGYAAMTADKEVDAEQSGSGMSPIIGVDLKTFR